ncbi:hypothetical protein [Candidatus Odyssella thessalonicensis]|uniref:hypothetical protein n=1 Tax=Candidatus Odyssella thessalonicensis TaxID=84647 RepID=UPI000225A90F|nr:hypothetical protein [Candidatus Odyssella thessalonicensis]
MKHVILISILSVFFKTAAIEAPEEPLRSLVGYGAESWQQIITLTQDIQILQDQTAALKTHEEKFKNFLISSHRLIEAHKELITIVSHALTCKNLTEKLQLQTLYQAKFNQLSPSLSLLLSEIKMLQHFYGFQSSEAMDIEGWPSTLSYEVPLERIKNSQFLNPTYTQQILNTLQRSAQFLCEHLTQCNHLLGQTLILQNLKKEQIKHKFLLQNQILGILQQTCGQLDWYLKQPHYLKRN